MENRSNALNCIYITIFENKVRFLDALASQKVALVKADSKQVTHSQQTVASISRSRQ